MLYLLVTGGIRDKRHEENFEFRESVWLQVSEELREFMLSCVATSPKRRAPTNQLLKSEFIKLHLANRLDVTPLEDTNLSPDNKNLFKFSAASAINEIFLRKKVINETILAKI